MYHLIPGLQNPDCSCTKLYLYMVFCGLPWLQAPSQGHCAEDGVPPVLVVPRLWQRKARGEPWPWRGASTSFPAGESWRVERTECSQDSQIDATIP